MMPLPSWLETLIHERGLRLEPEGSIPLDQGRGQITWTRSDARLELAWDVPGRIPRGSRFALDAPLSLQLSRTRGVGGDALHMALRQRDVRFTALAWVAHDSVTTWLSGLPWLALDPTTATPDVTHDALAELIAHLLAEDTCQLTRWDEDATREPPEPSRTLVAASKPPPEEPPANRALSRPQHTLAQRVQEALIKSGIVTLIVLLIVGFKHFTLALLLALPLALISFTLSMYRAHRENARYRTNVEVVSTIIDVKPRPFGDDSHVVEVRYPVGSSFQTTSLLVPNRDLERYVRGATLTLYVNPSNPKDAIAHPDGPKPPRLENKPSSGIEIIELD